ncbi:WAT1-related protein At1g09380-like [Macadamia integrifolia]|uniref:WAT1-related protein At1g09380-like n=1 Tax=Macadamia integrifolia TaxID=60698 RepID=UPI001C4F4688|nr:WAT1-related protein At1g09380-like [Macadamia integrifolia]
MGRELLYLPCLAMIVAQFCYAGMTLTSKPALDTGMNPFVLVAYRQIFAVVFLSPFAYFLERKTRPRITLQILCQIFLSSIFGATLNQCLYFLGLKYSTPIIVCALNNLLPAITFIIAIPFGLETVGIKRRSGQAKVVGTILCVGGAMLMSFYKGSLIHMVKSSIHWSYVGNMQNRDSSSESNLFLGPLLIVASCIAWSLWFIIQAKMSKTFTAPYSITALMTLMASIQCGVVAICVEHNISGWSLKSNVRLIAALYCGIVGSGIGVGLTSWCIDKRGPLYVSMFNPLVLVIVAIIGWAILSQELYVGSALGSVLIIVGLYAVLWGKEKEMDQITRDNELRLGDEPKENEDVELPVYSNGTEVKVNVGEEMKTG